MAPSTPVLDVGVVLRVRGKSGPKGDSTVKLRPCRWSQLSEDFFANTETDESELKIEADWAGDQAITRRVADDRLERTTGWPRYASGDLAGSPTCSMTSSASSSGAVRPGQR